MNTNAWTRIGIMMALLCCASSARAQNWIQVSELGSTDVYSIIEHDGALYSITADTIYKSTDAGSSWRPTTRQPNLTRELMRLYSYGAFIYAGTLRNGIVRSNDGGNHWESINRGLPSGGSDAITGLVGIGDTLYVGTDAGGVFALDLQRPTSWFAYNAGLFRYGVSALAASDDNLVASIGMVLFVRPRNSPEWIEVPMDSTGEQHEAFTFVTHGEHLFAGTNHGLFRSSRDAQRWESADLQMMSKKGIVSMTTHGSRLFVGIVYRLQHWIFSTDDAGATWEVRAHEFAELFDLHISGNRLWAGRTDGLWYLDLNIPADVKTPTRTSLKLNLE